METNEFLEKPVKGLFYRYLVPSIIGTMVTSIYVLADTIIIFSLALVCSLAWVVLC